MCEGFPFIGFLSTVKFRQKVNDTNKSAPVENRNSGNRPFSRGMCVKAKQRQGVVT